MVRRTDLATVRSVESGFWWSQRVPARSRDTINGELKTAGENVVMLEVEGPIAHIDVAGGISANGDDSDAVTESGAHATGLDSLQIAAAHGERSSHTPDRRNPSVRDVVTPGKTTPDESGWLPAQPPRAGPQHAMRGRLRLRSPSAVAHSSASKAATLPRRDRLHVFGSVRPCSAWPALPPPHSSP
jgi:hypothetical protein